MDTQTQAEMLAVLKRIKANQAAYLDSDLSHADAHQCLVDYELFEAVARAIEKAQGLTSRRS